MKYKFKAWDWDGGEFIEIPKENIVDAIHFAWNYEFDVYDIETGDLIFSGGEDNDGNSEMLEKYGLRLIDDSESKYRVLQSIETGEKFRPDWHK